jgi:hypothetical protein
MRRVLERVSATHYDASIIGFTFFLLNSQDEFAGSDSKGVYFAWHF